jgi:DNA-binding GntR family transcriptional regulator
VATSISKSAQITAQMRALIAENQFADGRLPSEPELAQMLQASRATIRQALSSLAAEGLLIRKQGVGTFVNERVLNIPTRLEEVWDFAEMIQLSGYTPGVQHLHLTLGPARGAAAEQLALDGRSAEVITTANVFLADGTPAIYCIDFIPAYLVNQAYRDEELFGPWKNGAGSASATTSPNSCPSWPAPTWPACCAVRWAQRCTFSARPVLISKGRRSFTLKSTIAPISFLSASCARRSRWWKGSVCMEALC